MGLRKPGEVEDQMCSFCSSSMSLLKPHFVVLLYVLLAIVLLIFSWFFGHSLFVTFVVLIVSTFTSLKFTKQKLGLHQKPVFEKTSTSTSSGSEVEVLCEETITDKEIITHEELRSQNEILTTKKEARRVDEMPERVPSDLSSEESESMDLSSTSEDSDGDWPFPNNMERIPECSDDSISDDDDENLIEIPLSSDDYCFGFKEEHKLKSQLSLSQLSSDSVFSRKGLLEELLAEINEINEEDNLIEIDLSMGSIKCSSGLEIHA